MIRIIFVVAVSLLNFTICVPISTTESLLFVAEGKSYRKLDKPLLPELKSMHVTSNIRNRYARSTVETKYSNPDDHAQEATFTITLPDTAFISGFNMEIDGKKYEAYVKEKEEAKKEYEAARERGQTAGHVEMNARDSEVFTVSVNIEPTSKVLFTLTYEQLLQRKNGKYEMVINLHPRQLVDDFVVDVNINETRRIINVNTPAIRSGNEILESQNSAKNQIATVTNLNEDLTEINIHFAPSTQQQKDMMTGSKGVDNSEGISGQLVVEYDVERDSQGGEVITQDGYFVHFFAPSDLEPIPKHIVFVLDVSGSMMGAKIKQLKQAMEVILGQLNTADHLHLIKFSTGVQVWNEQWINVDSPEFYIPPIQVSEPKIHELQNVVKQMTYEGMTNIYDALRVALGLTSVGIESPNGNIQPIIVFLTDGQANQGNSNYDEILKMVNSKNSAESKAAIFSLSFGDSANKDFLKKLASQNLGFMRTIYEASDASLQLQDFYQTISSPLLKDVNFIYTDQVSNLTKNKFDILFKGSELVVAGKLTDSSEKFVSIDARTAYGTNKFVPKISCLIEPPVSDKKREYGKLERLLAYITIKQLLDKKYGNKQNKNEITPEKEALGIALKYSFVTPVSSLVVIKPNSTESQNTKSANARAHGSDSSVRLSGSFLAHTGQNHYGTYMASLMPAPRTSMYMPPKYRSQMRRVSMSKPDLPMTSMTMPTMSMPMLPVALQSIEPTESQIRNDLPWIVPLFTRPGELTIDNQAYRLGDNSTSVATKTCQVNSLNLNGTCTLLSACPRIYPTLDSLVIYKKYFCTLESGRYAGVCCVSDH